MNERYLTIEELAKKLKVAKITIYRMARKGDIPAFKFGRSWRIDQAKLDKLFERKVKGGKSS
jgi:excisionase family DNA binding protein